jgi:hypothetical protein
MSNATLWARPAWDIDRWVREYFGPATANDWFKGFSPAAEKRSVAHLAETPPVCHPPVVRAAGTRRANRTGRRCQQGRRGAAHPD